MNKILIWGASLALGLGAGGAAVFGAEQWFSAAPIAAEPPVFVPTGAVLAPLVFPDGRLAGYASFEVELEVMQGESALVKEHMPLLLNAINMRTHRTPMASGPDGLLPDLKRFQQVVVEAAGEVFGAGVVRRAAITQAKPM
ncbi:hypothetical protein ACFOKI_06945 [Sphingomonas qilianensis]|uniref:Flagellar basal body-associated protein FliL n=1 Tax=Sphingomonas qilianensis TaxID=1736690 RepID=A0ABU9XQN4_9SPHN